MTIEFAGENPCVVLYDEQGNTVSAVSYWNANFSVAGPGRALLLLTRQDGQVRGRLLVEAGAPVDFLTGLNQHFLGFEAVEWASVPPEPARFEARWTGDAYRLTCSHDDGTIDATWRDFDDAQMLSQRSIDFGNVAGRSYDISSVIIGSSTAMIEVDGRSLPGSIQAPYGALPKSAFLAFCETWTRL
jgi:hypothetical protein